MQKIINIIYWIIKKIYTKIYIYKSFLKFYKFKITNEIVVKNEIINFET